MYKMPKSPTPGLIVTESDGAVTFPSDNQKQKLKKTKQNVVESPNLLTTPVKAKKLHRKPSSHEGRNFSSQPYDLTDTQLAEIREAFDFFDKDKRGFIPTKDIGDVMRSLGQNPTNAEIRDVIRELDTDGNGRIDFNEFVALMAVKIKSPQQVQEELRSAFEVFDLNGDGKISLEELKTVMLSMGEGLTAAEIKSVFDSWDTNKDGTIDYNEFCAGMGGESIFKS